MLKIIFIFIVLLNILVTQSQVTLIVDPSSIIDESYCGASVAYACSSIYVAINNFLKNSTFNGEYYPPLIIQLVAGDYYPSNTTDAESLPIPLYGLDVTIQPYNNDRVIISGEYLQGDGPFFSFDPSNGDMNTTSLTVNNIGLDQFKIPLIDTDNHYPLNIFFNNVQITNCASSAVYPNQLFIILSTNFENQTTLAFNNCWFEGNANILLSNGGYVTFTNTMIKKTIGTAPILSYTFYRSNTLIFENCTLDKNSGSSHGIVFTNGGEISFLNTLIKHNSAYCTVAVYNAKANFVGTSFYSNTGTNNGALLIQNSSISIGDCVFNQNTGKVGGAIYSTSNLNISNTSFQDNWANQGGAIYQTSPDSNTHYGVRIESSSFVIFQDTSSFSNQNMLYFQNAMVLMRGSHIDIGSTRVSNGYSMIDCALSSISFINTNITSSNNYAPMSCNNCDITDSAENGIQCPHSESSSKSENHNSNSESHHKSSSHSEDSHSSKSHSSTSENNHKSSSHSESHHDNSVSHENNHSNSHHDNSNENHKPDIDKEQARLAESILITVGGLLLIIATIYLIVKIRLRSQRRLYQPIN